MAYCTLDDLKDQVEEAVLVQLTDDENTGSVDTDRVARAIADADEEIDAHIGVRHRVPLDPVPAIIRKLSTDIAVYNLYARRGGPPDHWVERYKADVRMLERFSDGKLSLGALDPEGSPPATDAPQISLVNPPRIFDRRKMRDF